MNKKLLAVLVFGVFLFAPKAQATFHSEFVNVGQPQWSGECKAISTVSTPQVCGTSYKGVETGTQEQECQKLPPKGRFECKVGKHRIVMVTRSCTVVAPACPVTKVDNDENQEKCEAPGKVLGFRFMFVPEGNRLRWITKDDVSKVDIRVFGADQKTFLYDLRTRDDGEQFFSNRANFYKIRAVGACGLSPWSKMIN